MLTKSASIPGTDRSQSLQTTIVTVALYTTAFKTSLFNFLYSYNDVHGDNANKYMLRK